RRLEREERRRLEGTTAVEQVAGDLAVLQRGLDRRLGPGPGITHVIASDCSCTRGLVRHLTDRGPSLGRRESVLFVGASLPGLDGLEARGFDLHALAPEELRTHFAIDGAPVLVVRDPDRIVYAGGYFDLPAAIHARDQRIVAAVDAGRPPASLPLYGCAVSTELARARDPLGLRALLRGLEIGTR
ncbi:MAG: hypothetical protein AAF211_01225, partial [Myxococcota bacterium]